MNSELEQIGRERIRIVRELEGKKCFCGAKKTVMQTFCKRDYFALPKHMRDALYNRVCDGYEEAYAEARKYLEAKAKGDQ